MNLRPATIIALGAALLGAGLVACSAVLGFEPLTLDDGTTLANEGGAPDGSVLPSEADALPAAENSDAADAAREAGDAKTPSCGDTAADPKNCGACGHDCLGGACDKGTCQAAKLADGLAIPQGIAVNDGSVFVAEYDSNRILKFDKTQVPSACTTVPTPPQCVFTEDQANVFKPRAMAVDGTTVYWANGGGGAAHEIRSCPRGGCGGAGATRIATLASDAFGHIFGSDPLPLRLVLRGDRIYWSESNSGAIRSAQLDGGAPRTLLESSNFAPVAIAVDDTSVYFTDDTNQHPTRIQSVPLDGGGASGLNVKIISSTPARPFGIALTETGGLFWTIQRIGGVGDGLVQAADRAGFPDGGSPAGAFAATQIEPGDIIVDEKNVYWIDAGDDNAATGIIVYCKLTGCPTTGPIVLAQQQRHPGHLAQDASALYWSNTGLLSSTTYDGQVWKIAKP